ncbi:MAG: glyoxalase [Nitrospina sp.]|jgi:catechol 2,3-dioxygenase-like lactoylglutathione lyase family enzyme|nr:glyoxalase [Nitrospina sp.]
MITQIRHTGIVVEDLDIALEFYRDVLGFKVKKSMNESGSFIETILGLKGVEVTTVKMSSPDGNLIELLRYKTHKVDGEKSERKIFDLGISHIALTVDNLESDYKRIKLAGARFFSIPKTNLEGTAKVAFCEDPCGNILELVQSL